MEKIKAAILNPKAKDDVPVLNEILEEYKKWVGEMDSLRSSGDKKVEELVRSLNKYKDKVEIDLILGRGSNFLTRQKGQLKLDNSIMEEFLIRLMDPKIIGDLKNAEFLTGPNKSFMALSFRPQSFTNLSNKPDLILKTKDNDFILGKQIYYKFSSDPNFENSLTTGGKFALAVIAAECKINYDKTMFQECAGTASRLKDGVPYAKYYAIVEFLDMAPEDCALLDIDNVFLIRKAKRLPFEKRNDLVEVRKHRSKYPIDHEVLLKFVNEIRGFLGSTWYDSNAAIERGSFN